jgi:hypothetical protein
MDFRKPFFLVALSSALTLFGSVSPAFAQDSATTTAVAAVRGAPQPQSSGSAQNGQSSSSQSQSSQSGSNQDSQDKSSQHESPTAPDLQRKSPETPAGVPTTQKAEPLPQPKRILGVIPNYRAVSAGVLPPPPTSREAFTIATQNTFDYSGFFFVGITSLLAEGTESHPQLGKGVPGFWAYSWRGFLDKADGNYWVIWALPTVVHEDERYYSRGQGTIFHRGIYAASRVLITPNYHGKDTFNAAEIFGRGISQAISLTYYPSGDRSVGPLMQKYGYAVGRDALTNVFREFWPDIDAHVIHHHHRTSQ